jgi:hypothetical protein
MSIEMIAYDPVQGQVCWLTLREGFSNPTAAFGPGLAEYRPPPKTADSPWVPPTTSEALPIRAVAEPQESQRKRPRSKRHGQFLDGRAEIVDRRSISSGRLSLGNWRDVADRVAAELIATAPAQGEVQRPASVAI